MAGGFLTTHVLDTARGCPAEGLRIALDRVEGASRRRIAETVTNGDGRTGAPILPAGEFTPGVYELVFFAGDYLRATGQAGGQAGAEPMFLDEVPIRFGMAEDAHYHVPLLLSPYGYSTYRGS
jgi:5-hydroxyisourate hydrolase